MNIGTILQEYDGMFGKYSMDEINRFLDKCAGQAASECDLYSLIIILNEIIAFSRDTKQRGRALKNCETVINLMDMNNMKSKERYVTTLLNVANTYRTFGMFEAASKLYGMIDKLYEQRLNLHDMEVVSLYNNWSLLCQDMGEYEEAEKLLEKALYIIVQYKEMMIEQADTRTNLASVLIQLNDYDEAMEQLEIALSIYEWNEDAVLNYSSALCVAGDGKYMSGSYGEAAKYYRKALQEVEKHSGKTDVYNKIMKKYKLSLSKAGNIIIRCKEFYTECMAHVIELEFPKYEGRIAVGLAGPGSECFGFDDQLSDDENYGVRLCFWVSKETYDEIGVQLESVYERILDQYGGNHVHGTSGVYVAEDYFYRIIEMNHLPLDIKDWYRVKTENLATALNGEIFRDDEGIVTGIREKLADYPEKIRLLKLAEEVHKFSQCVQYNYGRMMAREDYVTASIAKSDGLKHVMKIVYLLNHKYAPYYKWLRKGMIRLEILPEVGDMLDLIAAMPDQRNVWNMDNYSASRLNKEDSVSVAFDKIAGLILAELGRQGIVDGESRNLDSYCNEIIRKAENHEKEIVDVMA